MTTDVRIQAGAQDPVALRHPQMTRFFAAVMARQMAASFRAVRLARPGLPDLPPGRPLVVYSNHPSWWDPAYFMVIHPRLFPDREGYGPMEAAMLDRYRFFRRIGIFGVDAGSRKGAARFLATSQAILADPRRMIWITAQGRFADPRQRPLDIRSGVAHLLARMPQAIAVPLALEYPFWSEKRPEALAAFGAPLEGTADAAAWAPRLERALTETSDRLATLAMARDPSAFVSLLSGRSGVGGVYETWQRLRSLARGERHVPDHMGEGG